MKEAVNLDDAYLIYEERYNLTKLAEESGLDMEKFQAFSSKEKFFTLAYKLKDTEHFHLASFFFNKLFEILQSMEALLNKIDNKTQIKTAIDVFAALNPRRYFVFIKENAPLKSLIL